VSSGSLCSLQNIFDVRGLWIWKSQEYLKTYGIGLLDNMDEAMALAKSGQPLENLAWAINGNFTTKRGTKWYKHGIHRSEYVDGVYKGLKKIVDDGLENGISPEEIALRLRKQLEEWRSLLERGKHFWY